MGGSEIGREVECASICCMEVRRIANRSLLYMLYFCPLQVCNMSILLNVLYAILAYECLELVCTVAIIG